MSNSPTSFRYPFALQDQPQDVQQAHLFAFNGILDLQNAIAALKKQVGSSTASTTTTVASGGTVIINGSNFPGLGGIRDQTGSTVYTVTSTDNGIFLILDDASPVAVTLNSALTVPYFLFATNYGPGTVTFTPSSGLVNGAASWIMSQGGLFYIGFDGTNWKTSDILTLAQSAGPTTHEWLNSYDASTGAFTLSQPAVADVTGAAPSASPTFTGTITQPDSPVLTAATTTTAATLGAATALPATPAGYLSISINSTVYKIPYFNV